MTDRYPRRIYGIGEIAAALGVDRTTIAKRVQRGSYGMPAPDWTIGAGHLWADETIEPWIGERVASSEANTG